MTSFAGSFDKPLPQRMIRHCAGRDFGINAARGFMIIGMKQLHRPPPKALIDAVSREFFPSRVQKCPAGICICFEYHLAHVVEYGAIKRFAVSKRPRYFCAAFQHCRNGQAHGEIDGKKTLQNVKLFGQAAIYQSYGPATQRSCDRRDNGDDHRSSRRTQAAKTKCSE